MAYQRQRTYARPGSNVRWTLGGLIQARSEGREVTGHLIGLLRSGAGNDRIPSGTREMNVVSFLGFKRARRHPARNTIRRHPNYVCSRLAPNHTWLWIVTGTTRTLITDNRTLTCWVKMLDATTPGVFSTRFFLTFRFSGFVGGSRASWYVTYGSR